MIKILNLKLVILLEFQNIRTFFTKGYTTNRSEEVFVINKVKNIVLQTHVINDLGEEEIVETFYKNELQKTNQKEFRIEKVIKRKDNKLQGAPQKCPYFSLAITFTKTRNPSRFFLHRY